MNTFLPQAKIPNVALDDPDNRIFRYVKLQTESKWGNIQHLPVQLQGSQQAD
ncbi:hypothetical protein PAMP_010624 [Pampus punctatissimus]